MSVVQAADTFAARGSLEPDDGPGVFDNPLQGATIILTRKFHALARQAGMPWTASDDDDVRRVVELISDSVLTSWIFNDDD